MTKYNISHCFHRSEDEKRLWEVVPEIIHSKGYASWPPTMIESVLVASNAVFAAGVVLISVWTSCCTAVGREWRKKLSILAIAKSLMRVGVRSSSVSS